MDATGVAAGGNTGRVLRTIAPQPSAIRSDVIVEGVIQDGRQARVLVSQRHIVGKAPQPREMAVLMRGHGFMPLPDFGWYQLKTCLAAFDAQSRYFLRAGTEIIPIDLILTPVEGELRSFLGGAIR